MRACTYQTTFVAPIGNVAEFLTAAFLALASQGFTHHSATMGRNEARIAAAQALRGFARACRVALARDDAGKAAVEAMMIAGRQESRRPMC